MCVFIGLGACDPEATLGGAAVSRQLQRAYGIVAKLAYSRKTGNLMSDHNGHQVMEKGMARKNGPWR